MKKITLLLVLFITITQLNAQTYFSKQNIVSAGSKSNQLQYVDVNNDNMLDIISLVEENGTSDVYMTIYQNIGSNKYKPIIFDKIHKWNSLLSFTEADFSGNYLPDIVTCTNDSIYLYENNGNFNFSRTTIAENIIHSYPYTTPLDAGDIDGDGLTDLVASSDSGIVIYYNLGNGTFSNGNPVSPFEASAKFNDIDNDGDLDIVYYSNTELAWLENTDGSGTYTFPNIIYSEKGIQGLSIADITNDNLDDLVIIRADSILWFENWGGGTFTPYNVISDTGMYYNENVYTTDYDGDGDIDIVSTSDFWGNAGNNVALFTNLDGYNFSSADSLFADKTHINVLDFGDANSDGFPDLIFSNKQLQFAYNYGDGNPLSATNIALSLSTCYTICPTDVNNDNMTDFITYSNSNNISWIKNHENNNLFTSETPEINNCFSRKIDTADFNNDNYLDILIFDNSTNKLYYYQNNGNETFTQQNIFTQIDDFFIGDLNKDNLTDLFITTTGNKTYWYKNDGSANFTQILIRNNRDYIQAISDLDNDNDIDILMSDGVHTYWLKNTGSETFTDSTFLFLSNNSYIADINGDNYPDVIGLGGGAVFYKPNDGSGNFGSIENMITNSSVDMIRIADINNDGSNDIVSGEFVGNDVYWFKNNGIGIFFSGVVIDTNILELSSLYLHDMDNDNFLDIVISSEADGKIAWYKNNTLKILTEPQDVTACNNEITTLSITASGVEEYQWYHSNSGSNYYKITDNSAFTGSNTANLNVLFSDSLSEDYFYCTIKNRTWSKQSDIVNIHRNYSAPVFSVKDTVLYLDYNGEVTLPADELITLTSSFCPVVDTTISKDTFDCVDIGFNNIAFYLSDGNNNFSQEYAIITIADSSKPQLSVTDYTLYLDNSGNGTLTSSDVVLSSSDNCGSTTITMSKTAFDCTDKGNNTVTVTATDAHSNAISKNVTITVVDDYTPVLSTTDTTIYVDNNGDATLHENEVVTSATDNCGTPTISLSNSTFNCSNIGNNSVTVTATDASTNSVNSTILVTVKDTISPVISCIANQTVTADASNFYTVNGTEFNPVSSSDNCGVLSITNDFNLSNTLENAKLPVGVDTITWTILDNNTNQTECTFIVTVNPHTTSIENVGDITISIFPNPTSGIFNIKTATKTSTIEIFDATGRMILLKETNQDNTTIDLTNYQNGIYTAKISTNNKIIYKKIIKR